MFVTPVGQQVMHTLRHGPASHHEIALVLETAPWVVRDALAELHADRLVRNELTARRKLHALTAQGWAEVYTHDQLTLGGSAA